MNEQGMWLYLALVMARPTERVDARLGRKSRFQRRAERAARLAGHGAGPPGRYPREICTG